MPDENGNLTRKELEAVIASGGSVLVDGKIISSIEGLDEALGAPKPEPKPKDSKK